MTKPQDLQVMMTMTGTSDEEWFYMVSVAAEARGGPLIAASLECMEAIHEHDDYGVVSTLQSLAAGIRDLTRLLSRIQERCDPKIFHEKIRPLLSGTKVSHLGILPQGVLYDVGDGQGQWRKYSGGSNAQSALIQFLDIVLGVTHSGKEGPVPYPTSAESPPAIGGFLEVRVYSLGDVTEAHSTNDSV